MRKLEVYKKADRVYNMYVSIKEKLFDEKTLNELSAIAKDNAYYAQSYVLDREKLS